MIGAPVAAIVGLPVFSRVPKIAAAEAPPGTAPLEVVMLAGIKVGVEVATTTSPLEAVLLVMTGEGVKVNTMISPLETL